jgi:hypothetical protein
MRNEIALCAVAIAGCDRAEPPEGVMPAQSAGTAVARATASAQGSPTMRARRLLGLVDLRAAGCCSQSCAARSTTASIDLRLAADGRLEARWSRAGCNVTLTGDGPKQMPTDPGPPEVLCGSGAHGPAREEIDLTGAGTVPGTWSLDGDVFHVTLDVATPPWTLRCEPDVMKPGRLVRCTAAGGSWEQATDLLAEGALYLADAPAGATVHVREPGFGARPQVQIAP